jgi:nucleolar MIF4G domain-containing protein 1
MVLLCELYNFQVISCILMYDLVRSLLNGGVSEMDVEILLNIFRGMCLLSIFSTLS